MMNLRNTFVSSYQTLKSFRQPTIFTHSSTHSYNPVNAHSHNDEKSGAEGGDQTSDCGSGRLVTVC